MNRGEVSPSVLARVDVGRVALSAETMVNWIPKTQGPMRIRPGLGYLGTSKSNLPMQPIPFVAATTDTAILEITNSLMRVRVSDALVTRPSVATSISNGSFATSTSWTDASTGGGVPSYGGSGLSLNATNRGGLAKVTRQITVAGPDQNILHGLAINVTRGPVVFRVGSTNGDDDYIAEMSLRAGRHSLAFTPGSSFWLTFQNSLDIGKIVASISVEASGTLEIVAPWLTADLSKIRWDQSADVVFVACDGYQQRRIERRNNNSWSIVVYAADDGPFGVARSAKVKLKAAANVGNTTLTSDLPFFKTTHVGALFRLYHNNFNETVRLGAENTYSDVFRVSGVQGSNVQDRDWTYTLTGTWVGTIRQLKSTIAETEAFKQTRDVDSSGSVTGVTTNGARSNNDGPESSNIVAWIKIGFDPGTYTSGVATLNVAYKGGSGWGVGRVTAYNSPTSVDIEVLSPFHDTVYTDNWQESIWSDRRGWPTAVTFHEGARLWWLGQSYAIGSVSDDYESFDPTVVGDSGPVIRVLGSGPVDTIHFGLSLGHLMMGTAGSILAGQSTSFGEPLTPTNMTARACSTQGAATMPAIKIDLNGVFVDRSTRRVFELSLGGQQLAYYGNYSARDLTLLHPDLASDGAGGTVGLVGIAVQRQPDTRVHLVLGDGTLASLCYNPAENLEAWYRTDTSAAGGFIEKVVVLPGTVEDQLYLLVRRTIGGNTVRYLEKMALESECVGGTQTKLADSFVVYNGSPTTTLTGLSHLEGQDVVVWADGADKSPDVAGVQTLYTVTGGQITLTAAVSQAIVGLPYEARYKSTKLAYAAAAGTALTQVKRVDHVGLILGTTHNNGIFLGPDFVTMDALPRVLANGSASTTDQIFSGFDGPSVEFPGIHDTDARLCIKGKSPRPAEVRAAVVSIQSNDKV